MASAAGEADRCEAGVDAEAEALTEAGGRGDCGEGGSLLPLPLPLVRGAVVIQGCISNCLAVARSFGSFFKHSLMNERKLSLNSGPGGKFGEGLLVNCVTRPQYVSKSGIAPVAQKIIEMPNDQMSAG